MKERRCDAADLLDCSIREAGQAIRDGHVGVAELTRACLERIGEIADLRAFVEVYSDHALRTADAHQALLECGCDLGPLHGIPIAIKDNIDLAGFPAPAGSTILAGNVPAVDATVVAKLKQAGAIIVGRNNMHEFAWGGTTANPHSGVSRNPWDPARSPAGSSGGSAVAVAARAVFAAIGTDTGGSVRNPAAMNGVSGIRPTIGRVSNAGVFPLAWSLDVVGPLAGSCQDCAVVLQVLAGPDSRDPQVSTESVPDYLAALDGPLAGLAVGSIANYSTVRVQPAVRAAFEATLARLSALGATVSEVTIPDIESVVDALIVIGAAEPAALHVQWLRERGEDYGPDVRAQLEAGLALSAVDYVQAQRLRAHIRAGCDAAFAHVDALLTPTLPFTAPVIGQSRVEIDGESHDVHTGNMQFTSLGSVTGLPASSVPMGFDDGGLPIGLQIIVPAFGEARALRIGHQLQLVTDFHRVRPPRTTTTSSRTGWLPPGLEPRSGYG